MVRGLYRHRSFIWQNAVAELRHRYAGTNLGVVWNVLHPLALIAVYAAVFTGIMKGQLDKEDVPNGLHSGVAFVLYLTSGLLPWLAFAECLTRGCNAFTDNATYLKKLPIPEQVFVAQTATSATLGLAISFSMLLVVSLALGLRPTWHWWLLPIPLVALQLLGFGLGLLCGTLNVFFRDIGPLLTLGLQLVLWTVPIVYLEETVPEWLSALLRWHPMYPSLHALRELFLFRREMPPPELWLAMLAWPLLACTVAWLAFRKLRPEIRYLL